ncbi:hypothetical protein ACJJTC_005811 [Scirpophaga incertulas]
MANYIEEVATDIDQISVGDSILVGDLNSLQVYRTKFNNSLKILVQNIRSLNKNFTDFEVFLARCKVNYDVIVLTECWLQYNNNVPELESFRTLHLLELLISCGLARTLLKMKYTPLESLNFVNDFFCNRGK